MRRRSTDLVELSHAIHAEPELAFAEHRSCAKTQALVAERGFEITAAAGGLDTAFRADFGSGPLAVGVCAEYDALPGIGHACGHNIIAASAVGAALALADVADELGLTVALLGTPAEEFGGGKVLLLNAGVFDDLAVAVMVHPGPVDIAAARSLTLSAVRVTTAERKPMRRPRRTWASTPPTRPPSRRWRSGCCVSSWPPGSRCTASSPTAGRPPTSSPAHTELQYTMRATEASSLRRPGSQGGRLLPGRCGGHRLRLQRRADRADVRRAQPRPLAGRDASAPR